MINKQLNNKGLSEIEKNMRTYIVQEHLRTQGKLVTPFTLIRINQIYETIDYSTKAKLFKKINERIDWNE